MNMQLDSDYLQRQLKILADDMRDDDPNVAKAYLFIRNRLHQSFPDGDVSRKDVEDLLHEPQGRKHLQNMPEWAIDHLFESRISKKKIIKESKLTSWINKIITEEIRKVRLKENQSQQEIEDLAVDLIDYMGKQLPVTGWKNNPRIMGFFREQNILDGKVIQQIYQKALQMNAE